MSDLVRGAAPPPKQNRLDVIRIVSSEPHQLIVVSAAIFGQPVHWHGRRSHECTAQRGNCKACEDMWPCKWQGYLHVMRPQANWQGFLEITQTAWEMILDQVPKGQTLRGLIVRVGRTKGGSKGRYMIEVLERRIDPESLPEEKDPLGVLRMLWRSKKGPLSDA